MSDREVWEKVPNIAAAFAGDGPEHFADRLSDIFHDTANPQHCRLIAVAVDIIVAASKQ